MTVAAALARLDLVQAQASTRPAGPLRDIELTMIAEARRGLTGETPLRGRDLRRLSDQILSGRFGAAAPERVD